MIVQYERLRKESFERWQTLLKKGSDSAEANVRAVQADEQLFLLAHELRAMEMQLPEGYTYAGSVPVWWED